MAYRNGNVIINGVVMCGKLGNGATIEDRMPRHVGAKRMAFIKRHCAMGRKTLRLFTGAMERILHRHPTLNARRQDEAVDKYCAKMKRKGLIPEMRGLMCSMEAPDPPPSGIADEQEPY
jgi:hypothetical protein